MAQHTPGPWTWEGDHTHRRFNIRQFGHLIGTSDQAKHICTVNNLPDHVAANRDADVAEANARLIAAAPDLLAALKGLLPMWESGIDEPWVTAARAVIAKAEGRA